MYKFYHEITILLLTSCLVYLRWYSDVASFPLRIFLFSLVIKTKYQPIQISLININSWLPNSNSYNLISKFSMLLINVISSIDSDSPSISPWLLDLDSMLILMFFILLYLPRTIGTLKISNQIFARNKSNRNMKLSRQ